jgi:hypothetical protein
VAEDNAESATVRSEFRALKTAVFANASNGIVRQDTQDCLDRPNTGWDAIHKLAAEQNPPSHLRVASNPGNSKSVDPRSEEEIEADFQSLLHDDDARLNSLLNSQTQAETQEREAEFKLVTAKRASQLARQQAAAAKKERQHLERQQVRERGHAARREEYERKWGRPPVCPRYNRSEDCDGTQCRGIGNGRFSHPDRCLDPAHVIKGLQGECLLWHFWDLVKTAEYNRKRKEKAVKSSNSQWGAKGGSGGNLQKETNGRKGNKAVHGNSHQHRGQKSSKEMEDLKAQVAEMKTLLSMRCTTEAWPALPPPEKSLTVMPPTPVTPPAPSPTAALKQIAALLKAFA